MNEKELFLNAWVEQGQMGGNWTGRPASRKTKYTKTLTVLRGIGFGIYFGVRYLYDDGLL